MAKIQFHKNNMRLLKEHGEGSYDKIINDLIDELEDRLPIVNIDYSPVSTIVLDESTVTRISAHKISEGESLENVVLRLLLAKDLYSPKE